MIRDIEINLWLFCRLEGKSGRGWGVCFSVGVKKWMSLAFVNNENTHSSIIIHGEILIKKFHWISLHDEKKEPNIY